MFFKSLCPAGRLPSLLAAPTPTPPLTADRLASLLAARAEWHQLALGSAQFYILIGLGPYPMLACTFVWSLALNAGAYTRAASFQPIGRRTPSGPLRTLYLKSLRAPAALRRCFASLRETKERGLVRQEQKGRPALVNYPPNGASSSRMLGAAWIRKSSEEESRFHIRESIRASLMSLKNENNARQGKRALYTRKKSSAYPQMPGQPWSRDNGPGCLPYLTPAVLPPALTALIALTALPPRTARTALGGAWPPRQLAAWPPRQLAARPGRAELAALPTLAAAQHKLTQLRHEQQRRRGAGAGGAARSRRPAAQAGGAEGGAVGAQEGRDLHRARPNGRRAQLEAEALAKVAAAVATAKAEADDPMVWTRAGEQMKV
ncbi:hypothetical protein T492DRAFT_850690 [Pavlovales sp. CCMP2436]|nr:hypothetical protein T492DRAFT_850690 [Pavlovales sp. CCMP2436]